MPQHQNVPKSEFDQRFSRTLAKMEENELAALIVSTGQGKLYGRLSYLTGLSPSCLDTGYERTSDLFYLLCQDGRSQCFVQENINVENLVNTAQIIPAKNPLSALVSALKKLGFKQEKIGVAGFDTMTAACHIRLTQEFPKIMFQDATSVLDNQRMIKSPTEIGLLREAAVIGDESIQAGMAVLQPGLDTQHIKTVVEKACLDADSTMAPEVRVCAGKTVDSLRPQMENHVLEKGDFVFIEVAGRHGGYACSVARAGLIGKPNKAQEEFLNLVEEAGRWMREVIKPNKKMEFVPTEARSKLITPRIHGIGLDMVEPPEIFLNRYFSLKTGTTLSISPVVNAAPYGNLHRSDIVVVTETGVELLSAGLNMHE